MWKAQFSSAAKVLALSQGEDEAWDLLSKARFIWNREPEYMRLPIEHDARGWAQFSTGSEIKALPSTDKAGRGTDATLVIRDELAKHPYGADNYTAISPAIDSGGQLVDLSTIDKIDPQNHFTERIQKALIGANKKTLSSGLEVYTSKTGALLVFAGWKLRPVRQEGMTLDEWFETRIKPKYSAFEIEQEYPATLDESLKPSQAKAFFDTDALESMRLQFQTPIPDFKGFDIYNGRVRVYKPPSIGRSYVIFTDPSNGIEDPFVTVVMDAVTGEGVCTATGKLHAQEVGRIHDMLVRAYNNAYNTGEVNAQAGGSFIDTLVALETPNRAPRRSPDGKIVLGKVGWQTNQPLRDKALHELAEAVRTQQITVHDKEAIEEFRHFIRNDVGKLVAMGKEHDDWVMAWAGANYIRRFRPISGFSIESGKYKD